MASLLGMSLLAMGNSQTLRWLGTLTYSSSLATDISADGSVVVGLAFNQNFDYRAFYWRDGVMTPIEPPRWQGWSQAFGVSGDGNVVVGDMMDAIGNMVAFRWTQAGGVEFLGALGGVVGRANAASYDGSIIVGMAETRTGSRIPFRWREGVGMQDLGIFNETGANGVSGDGSVIIGNLIVSGFQNAFRWTESGVQQLTGFGGAIISAEGITTDGSIIVGYSGYPDGTYHACRWLSPNQPPQDLHTLSSSVSIARDVSDDGSVVVGQHYTVWWRAFRWTPQRGMEDLNTVYADLLRDGSVLYQALAVSADGRFITGSGLNASTGRREAFLLDTRVSCQAHDGDVDANGCVDDADLLAVLFAFGATGDGLGRVDVNCDATVDDADLLQVLFNFGGGC